MENGLTHITHEHYMLRCLQLAQLGEGMVAPNPMVGSVLVYEDRIIGEGYHQEYGQAHAEVSCLSSVRETDRNLIAQSTLYVSLEPCAHFGKTPPCANLIVRHNIPRVVVGCRDPFKEVDGKGIEKLQQAGIDVTVGVLEEECKALNRRFFTFHTTRQPYIVLKWAETANHFIGSNTNERLLISNDTTNRLVHKWRSEEAAILVGTNTARLDNPSLCNRLWTGKQPIRLVIDRELQLPRSLHLFNGTQQTIVFNHLKDGKKDNVLFYQVDKEQELLPQVMEACHRLNIQSILVEGGRNTLQSFMDNGLWNEARVIANTQLSIAEGVPAPVLHYAHINHSMTIGTDKISFYDSVGLGYLINPKFAVEV